MHKTLVIKVTFEKSWITISRFDPDEGITFSNFYDMDHITTASIIRINKLVLSKTPFYDYRRNVIYIFGDDHG